MKKALLPSQRKWISQLAAATPNLRQLVRNIQSFKEDECPVGASPEYDGPRIFLYPDANIEIREKKSRYLNRWARDHPEMAYDVLPIVKIEKIPGGIKRKFPNLVPADIARGQRSLEKRCEGLNIEASRDINLLFDVIVEYFNREMGDIYGLADRNPHLSNENLARLMKCSMKRDHYYYRFVRKAIENYRKGNPNNYLADRILTTTSFGFNLTNPWDKSVIISYDSDLIAMFDIFYEEILPRYMARTALETMEHRGVTNYADREKEFCAAAREHIRWARDSNVTDNITLGVLYIPGQKFYTREVSSAFVNFFNGLTNYRYGKSDMLAEMVKTGQKPGKIIKRLMARRG